MSHIFHDWNNGLKCKKLIWNLQCRLKTMKNDGSYEAKQLREDMSQLLHHGLQHHAFDKAEKLFKTEHEVIIYDLLDNFCEFMINFSYTNEHKDSPNAMDEAISSLIFSSSRLRDLPELIHVRKLFQKLYGERFANVALELLPGNLVNQQIKDCFLMISESVSVKMKFRLMNEIARNCLKSGPLLIDNPAAELSTEGEETSEDETWSIDIGDNDVEARILEMDSSSKSQNCAEQSVHSSCSIGTSSPFSDIAEYYIVKNEERELKFEDQFDFSDYEFIDLVPRTSPTPFKDRIVGVEESDFSMVVESSSESSAAFGEEIIYSDDIEDHESAVEVEGSIHDQRVFKFPPSNRNRVKGEPECNKFDECREENPCYLCKTEGVDDSIYEYLESLSPEEKEELIQDGLICMKALSIPPKRLEKLESGDIYQREHCKKKHLNREFRRNPRNKSISVEKGCINDPESARYYGVNFYRTLTNRNRVNEEPELKRVENCSEENPCYLCKSEGMDYLIYQSFEGLSSGEKDEFIQDGLICMRAFSMPPKRLEKYDIMESTSITSSTCHVHPKLPDSDDLSTRFFALKQAYLGGMERVGDM